MKNDFGLRAMGSKWEKMTLDHKWKMTLSQELLALNVKKQWFWVRNKKTTLGQKLRALNAKEMTLGHKWKTTMGWELWALNGKEMTLGHQLKLTLGQEL